MLQLGTFFSRDSRRLIWVSFGAAFLLNIILWVTFLGKFGFTGETGPLHFSIVSGINLVGDVRNLYQMPAFGLLALLVNFFLYRSLRAENILLRSFLTGGAFATQALLLIGALAIIFLQ